MYKEFEINFAISVLDKDCASLFCISFDTRSHVRAYHFLVRKPYRLWGRHRDNFLGQFGLGPLFLYYIG